MHPRAAGRRARLSRPALTLLLALPRPPSLQQHRSQGTLTFCSSTARWGVATTAAATTRAGGTCRGCGPPWESTTASPRRRSECKGTLPLLLAPAVRAGERSRSRGAQLAARLAASSSCLRLAPLLPLKQAQVRQVHDGVTRPGELRERGCGGQQCVEEQCVCARAGCPPRTACRDACPASPRLASPARPPA